jgi:ABC-type phosphate/phosphonate transport system substrate-binding protein
MKRIIAAFALVGLVGCTPPQQAATSAKVNTGLAMAQADLQTAQMLWGIAAGLAQVAGKPVPPQVATLLQAAQTALDSASTDAPAIEALAAQITAQANAVTVQAAPAIKAVKS